MSPRSIPEGPPSHRDKDNHIMTSIKSEIQAYYANLGLKGRVWVMWGHRSTAKYKPDGTKPGLTGRQETAFILPEQLGKLAAQVSGHAASPGVEVYHTFHAQSRDETSNHTANTMVDLKTIGIDIDAGFTPELEQFITAELGGCVMRTSEANDKCADDRGWVFWYLTGATLSLADYDRCTRAVAHVLADRFPQAKIDRRFPGTLARMPHTRNVMSGYVVEPPVHRTISAKKLVTDLKRLCGREIWDGFPEYTARTDIVLDRDVDPAELDSLRKKLSRGTRSKLKRPDGLEGWAGKTDSDRAFAALKDVVREAGVDRAEVVHALVTSPPFAAFDDYDTSSNHRSRVMYDLGRVINEVDAEPPPATKAKVPSKKGEAITSGGITLTPASEYTVVAADWLWEPEPDMGRIPLGEVTIVAGDPDVGKSQFLIWLTAQITNGTLPGEFHGRPGGVILATTEDSWGHTVVPRLIAAGADLSRVFSIKLDDDQEQLSSFVGQIDEVGRLAAEHNVKLIGLDPLVSSFDNVDTNSIEVRHQLERLVSVAQQRRLSILGLGHFRKAEAENIGTRLAGHGAFYQVPRAGIALGKDEDGDGNPLYILSQFKNNLGRANLPSFQYTIEAVTVQTKNKEGRPFPKFVLGHATTDHVNEILSRSERAPIYDCIDWLRTYLEEKGGWEHSKIVRRDFKKNGFYQNTVYRAIKRGGFKKKPFRNAEGKNDSVWCLPGVDPDEVIEEL